MGHSRLTRQGNQVFTLDDHEKRIEALERRFVEPDADVHSWMVLSTANNGWEYTESVGSDGKDDTVDWYEVYLSDNAENDFDFEVEAGGGQFDEDIAHGLLLRSGILTFSLMFYTNDFDVVTDPFFLEAAVQYGGGLNPDCVPGFVPGFELFHPVNVGYPTVEEGGGGDFDMAWQTSWTVPVFCPDSTAPNNIGDVQINVQHSNDADMDDIFWTVRLWIVRHGPLRWPDGDDFSDPTWVSGA